MKNHITEFLSWKGTHTTTAATAYRAHLVRFASIIKKDPRLVTLSDVSRVMDTMRLKYAPSTVAYSCAIFKSFFAYLQAIGVRSVPPSMIKIPRFLPTKREVATKEDVRRMCRTLNEWELWGLQKLVVIRLLWETGMRVSELCSLNVADLDSRKRYTQVETKKARQLRWIYWTKRTHALLMRYLGSKLAMNQNPWLFMSQRRRIRLTPRTVERWIEEIRAKAGIRNRLIPHSFRHGKGHYMSHHGASAQEISVTLGHKNLNSVLKYLDFDEPERRKIAEKYL